MSLRKPERLFILLPGTDILVGAGNTELFTHDVLGLDRRDDEHGQPVVDEDANFDTCGHVFGYVLGRAILTTGMRPKADVRVI